LDIDFASIIINERRAAAWSHHNAVSNVRVDSAVDRLEPLALIDDKVALPRLKAGGPCRAAKKHCASKDSQDRMFVH
jgi:hypothetical protein